MMQDDNVSSSQIPISDFKISGTRYRAHWFCLLIIATLTFTAYSNVLHGETQFDDERYLFSHINLISLESYKNSSITALFNSGLRPLTAFTFAINYEFWGKDTFSYHLTNIFIHLISGILVYIFVYMTITIIKQGAECRAQSAEPNNPMRYALCAMPSSVWTAFLAALIFSIHPIQTESVSYIYQRAESLSALFYLLSLIIFIKSSTLSGVKALICNLIYAFTFFLALAGKETAITLPLISILYGLLFFERKGMIKKIAMPAALLIAAVVIAFVRISILGKHHAAGFYLKEFGVTEYMLTQMGVIVSYLKLLVLPIGQNLDHAYPVSRSFFEPRTFLSFLFLFSIFSIALYILYRSLVPRPSSLVPRPQSVLFAFSILWFFITLAPSSSILPLRDLMAEHRLYLPSLGIFIILSIAILRLASYLKIKLPQKQFIIVCSVLFFVTTGSLWASTFDRNFIWSSKLAMWQDVVKKSPNNARGYNNLSACYLLKGDYINTVTAGLNSLTLDPANIEAYYNIGLAFEKLGNYKYAKEFFIVFAKYSHKSYLSEIKRVSSLYGIDNNTIAPDFKTLLLSAHVEIAGFYKK